MLDNPARTLSTSLSRAPSWDTPRNTATAWALEPDVPDENVFLQFL